MTHRILHLGRRPFGAVSRVAAAAGRGFARLSARLPAVEFISQAEEDRRLEELDRLRACGPAGASRWG